MAEASRIRANNRYRKDTYKTLQVAYHKEEELSEKINEHCIKYGYLTETGPKKGDPNKSAFILKAIETQMKIDRGELKIVE